MQTAVAEEMAPTGDQSCCNAIFNYTVVSQLRIISQLTYLAPMAYLDASLLQYRKVWKCQVKPKHIWYAKGIRLTLALGRLTVFLHILDFIPYPSPILDTLTWNLNGQRRSQIFNLGNITIYYDRIFLEQNQHLFNPSNFEVLQKSTVV